MDTIFALSSGRPPAAIAVLRISGPLAFAAAETLAGTLPDIRRAALRTLRRADGSILDRALTIRFAAPSTATGEDLVEFHCHGGRAVVSAVEASLSAIDGLRPAQAGEFTRRALANGRIDLAEAGGLADLLAAETEQQRIAAMAAAEGLVSQAIRGWMERILLASARTEMLLDYGDEDDVAADRVEVAHLSADIQEIGHEIIAVASQPSVDRLHDGIRVVIAGPPNSGKSTLVNGLAQRDAAIVSPIAGTTRDRIEVPVMREGIPYVLIDTAGLHEGTGDVVEAIGMRRASDAVAAADLLVWTGDDPPSRSGALWLHMRSDEPARTVMPSGPDLAASRDDAASLSAIWDRIVEAGKSLVPGIDRLPLKSRQQQLCRRAGEQLVAAPDTDLLLMAEMLRDARNMLGSILGWNTTEAMLDALFARFCVGK